MKKLLFTCIMLSTLTALACSGAPKPKLIFETSEMLSQPESVIDTGDFVYISNIDGSGEAKDGSGWIQKIEKKKDGIYKVVNKKWVSGLDAPKGLTAFDNKLYVTDIDRVHEIDMTNGNIIQTINVGARFLNDIVADDKGNLYVSDTYEGKIYYIDGKDKSITLFKENMTDAPNGLFVRDGKLYIVSWSKGLKKDWSDKISGTFFYIDLNDPKKAENYLVKNSDGSPKAIGFLDGVEPYCTELWLVSDKKGNKVYMINSDTGKVETITDKVTDVADIGYDFKNKILYAPLTKGGELKVFTLK